MKNKDYKTLRVLEAVFFVITLGLSHWACISMAATYIYHMENQYASSLGADGHVIVMVIFYLPLITLSLIAALIFRELSNGNKMPIWKTILFVVLTLISVLALHICVSDACTGIFSGGSYNRAGYYLWTIISFVIFILSATGAVWLAVNYLKKRKQADR